MKPGLYGKMVEAAALEYLNIQIGYPTMSSDAQWAVTHRERNTDEWKHAQNVAARLIAAINQVEA